MTKSAKGVIPAHSRRPRPASALAPWGGVCVSASVLPSVSVPHPPFPLPPWSPQQGPGCHLDSSSPSVPMSHSPSYPPKAPLSFRLVQDGILLYPLHLLSVRPSSAQWLICVTDTSTPPPCPCLRPHLPLAGTWLPVHALLFSTLCPSPSSTLFF